MNGTDKPDAGGAARGWRRHGGPGRDGARDSRDPRREESAFR